MANTDQTTIAEVYARSLLELAIGRGESDVIDREFAEFAALLQADPDFKAFVTARVIDADQRRKSLDVMFQGRMSELLLNTLHVLNNKDRLEIVGEVQRLYHELTLQQQAIVEVHVRAAEPLSDVMRTRLQQLMESRTGRTVRLAEHVDPAILGGLIVRVGDEQIDMSVARQLHRFQKRLLEHAQQNIHAGTELFEGATEY
ncbi:MAG: ATP synthase F1 subunit delta [Planctomycetota bacterium]|nr:ATP synthase F1 subunit delta [Planctomycetota bacterium]